MDGAIVSAGGVGALNAEHYQTFEMAKANDTIIGGNDIAQIRTYAAYVRAQAQVIHKTIATTNSLDDVTAIKAEMVETERTLAKVGIFCDQRIGELLKELPTSKGGRPKNSPTTVGEFSKGQAIKDAGISKGAADNLQQLADHPDIVEETIAKADEEGKPVSRAQVLKAIKGKKENPSAGQRAASAIDRYGEPKSSHEQEKLAQAADVDTRTIRRVTRVKREDAELYDQVRNGDISAKQADNIVAGRDVNKHEHKRLEDNVAVYNIDSLVTELTASVTNMRNAVNQSIEINESMGVKLTSRQKDSLNKAIERVLQTIEKMKE